MEKEKVFKVFMAVNLYIVSPQRSKMQSKRKTFKKPSPFPQLLVLYLKGFSEFIQTGKFSKNSSM